MKKAFTLVELIFVIVIIGILSSIAIPKLAATRDDAELTKAISTIASVKAAVSTERQLRVLRGDFTPITSLNADNAGAFTVFSADRDGNKRSVLETTVPTCGGSTNGCWNVAGTTYTYVMPGSGGATVDFNITNGQFNCKVPSDTNCKKLTQ